jgi:hypothetical protein
MFDKVENMHQHTPSSGVLMNELELKYEMRAYLYHKCDDVHGLSKVPNPHALSPCINVPCNTAQTAISKILVLLSGI